MCGAIHPLPNMPSQHGAQLKHRDNFAFTKSINYEAQQHVIFSTPPPPLNTSFPLIQNMR